VEEVPQDPLEHSRKLKNQKIQTSCKDHLEIWAKRVKREPRDQSGLKGFVGQMELMGSQE
jgi:3-deoxy-D-arabino-heptulosonate 7-phosphate (DAHP) synthase